LNAEHTKLFFTETGNGWHQLSVVNLNTQHHQQGSWQHCPKAQYGDGGPARSANLFNPKQVTVDKQGHIFIADQVVAWQAVHCHRVNGGPWIMAVHMSRPRSQCLPVRRIGAGDSPRLASSIQGAYCTAYTGC
jgi:hypothetical protein